MIHYKTEQEIELMKEGGKRLKEVVRKLKTTIQIGVTTEQIDNKAEQLIVSMGGEPSFKRVTNYYWSTCLSINEQIVHTPPSKRVVKSGDVLKLDIGMFYKGFHTDYAETIAIGEVNNEKKKFLEVGKATLEKAVERAQEGRYVGEISQVIEQEIRKNNYSIVKELTGHGVGRELHEDPYVPNYLDNPIEKTLQIRSGLTMAIEPIYSMGKGTMKYEGDDDWSIRTVDGSIAAQFEYTIAVTHKYGTIILT